MASFAVLGALALLAQPVHPAPLNARQAASNFAAIPASAWTALGTQVGGRLQPGYPMGRPCFTLASPGTQGSLDPVACLAVQQNYTSELGIVEYFGGYLTAQWPSPFTLPPRPWPSADCAMRQLAKRRTRSALSTSRRPRTLRPTLRLGSATRARSLLTTYVLALSRFHALAEGVLAAD